MIILILYPFFHLDILLSFLVFIFINTFYTNIYCYLKNLSLSEIYEFKLHPINVLRLYRKEVETIRSNANDFGYNEA